MSAAPLLMIFVKYPEPGRVKTRIAAETGAEAAAAIYREMVQEVLDALPEGQKVRVLYDGFRPLADYQQWLQHPALAEAEFAEQSTGDLGERLREAFANAFRGGWRHVGVIGSDCLELTSEIYMEAWAALGTRDVVIGPTFDGGYYFLLLKAEQPALFTGIEWSSERVFAQTIAAAKAEALSVFALQKLNDIDTRADWEHSRSERQGLP
ncbi:MAG TPA: TIGR04282 family arsenosugar biosynthesis glycosyltransferase [Chthoniobacterales bacterium]|jgi:hypothetical protein